MISKTHVDTKNQTVHILWDLRGWKFGSTFVFFYVTCTQKLFKHTQKSSMHI